MFREMRLQSNKTTHEEAVRMFEEATNGVLAVIGDGGRPYAVPLSFAYEDDKIYFHSTSDSSHKIDAIKANPEVSFCVVLQDKILPREFNTLYRSAMAFGKARILTETNEIEHGIMCILKKYAGDYIESGLAYRDAEKENFCVVEIAIRHMTGKAGS